MADLHVFISYYRYLGLIIRSARIEELLPRSADGPVFIVTQPTTRGRCRKTGPLDIMAAGLTQLKESELLEVYYTSSFGRCGTCPRGQHVHQSDQEEIFKMILTRRRFSK